MAMESRDEGDRGSEAEEKVLGDFRKNLSGDEDVAIPVAAIQALTGVIERSTATTMMGLEIELRAAADALTGCDKDLFLQHGKTSIALSAGCELFLRYVTRAFLDIADFSECKRLLISRGKKFTKMSLKSREKIANIGHSFVRDGSVVLVHGSSRVVRQVLLTAASRGKHFSVIATEGRPHGDGRALAEPLLELGIPVTLILDCAIGYKMQEVDMVLVGAEGVVESGGIVNKIGTYSLAIIAKAFNKPVYVAAESYKFARLFPLSQADLAAYSANAQAGDANMSGATISRNEFSAAQPWEPHGDLADFDFLAGSGDAGKKSSNADVDGLSNFGKAEGSKALQYDNPPVDYTPPSFITLLFTDLGILTPSAVSDELIKLYQ